ISYDWPGNVRELENCIQHMVAINSGPLLHVGDLPSMLQNHLIAKQSQNLPASYAAAAPSRPASDSPAHDHRTPAHPVVPLSQVEKNAILGALEYTNGDRAVAANLLGIGRTTLYRKLKEYQVAV